MGQDDVGMSYQEKRALASMVGSILIAVGYAWYVYQSNLDTGIDWANDYRAWAKIFLYFIPVMIGFKILLHIIFVIITKITTDEDDPGFNDERDKLVVLKSERISHIFYSIGFVIALVALVMGHSIGIMFVLVFSFSIASAVLGDLMQVYFYRRGV